MHKNENSPKWKLKRFRAYRFCFHVETGKTLLKCILVFRNKLKDTSFYFGERFCFYVFSLLFLSFLCKRKVHPQSKLAFFGQKCFHVNVALNILSQI